MPDPGQLAFDFAPQPPANDLVERVVAAGFAPNRYILDLNRTLTAPATSTMDVPWSLPSRLFRFPLAFIEARRRADSRAAVLLQHPELGPHPFVQEVEATLGERFAYEPHDEFGRDFGALPRWWHACDLMCEATWRDLLATRRFTDDGCIAGAVCCALSGPAYYEGRAKKDGRISLRTAREVLAAIGADEPPDRSDAVLVRAMRWTGHIVERDRRDRVTSERWAFNILQRGPAAAWAHVHGLEDGWLFRDRSGFLQVKEMGRSYMVPPRPQGREAAE